MKRTLYLLLAFLLLNSCKNSKEKINEMLLNYVKTKVRNPNTAIIHSFQVYERISTKDSLIYNEESKSNTITERTEFIRVIFSAKNSDGKEVFRNVDIFLDGTKNKILRSAPENIDVENGYLTGNCKYTIRNLLSLRQIQNYCDGSIIMIVNIDTLGGKTKYLTKVQNGTYEINQIRPGNYFLKIIDYKINFKNIYTGFDKNKFVLYDILEIMSFYKYFAAGYGRYGYSNQNLFNVTMNKIEALKQSIQYFMESTIDESEVSNIWNNFKMSINQEFLNDFDIDDDYKYLNSFINLRIEPSIITNKKIEIEKEFY